MWSLRVRYDTGAIVLDMAAATSPGAGQISRRYTGAPSRSRPTGSVVRSTSTVPASAYATTSGGEARNDIRTWGWMRPSKLRLPDSTATTDRSFSSIAAATSGDSGPELPMHVVQPNPTR